MYTTKIAGWLQTRRVFGKASCSRKQLPRRASRSGAAAEMVIRSK